MSSQEVRPALRYVAAGRMYVTFALVIVAGFVARFAMDASLPTRAELNEHDVVITYAGPLEKVVSRGGVNHGSTHFDGGLGIGIENYLAKDELIKKLRPVLYLPFSDLLALSEQDAARVLRAGPELHITVHDGSVVAASNASGEVLPFQNFEARVLRRRSTLFSVAWVSLAAALAYFGLATAISRRAAKPQ